MVRAGLPNFGVVAPGIYRGAAPMPSGWAVLKALGVRTEIDLRIERKGRTEAEAGARSAGIDRIRIPLGSEAPTPAQVRTFLSVVDDPSRLPVYVHCQYGADRTGAMIGIYRVTRQGWPYARTYAEMRRYGFKPFLHALDEAVRSRSAD
jgi:protein tyrosine/serine phosphatase